MCCIPASFVQHFGLFFANTCFRLHLSPTNAMFPPRLKMEKFRMLAKHSWLAPALILACPALACAQLRFTHPAANLGELRRGPIYPHPVEFVNDSSQPLGITDL